LDKGEVWQHEENVVVKTKEPKMESKMLVVEDYVERTLPIHTCQNVEMMTKMMGTVRSNCTG
jgi:hypothetical protein